MSITLSARPGLFHLPPRLDARQGLKRCRQSAQSLLSLLSHRAPSFRGAASVVQPSEKPMRKSGEKAPQTWGNAPQVWGDALRALHPVKTAAHVAADCGLPPRTVEKWLAGSSAPSADAFLRLILVYGPALLASLCPDAPEWLEEAARFEEAARLAAEQQRLGARLAALRFLRAEVRA